MEVAAEWSWSVSAAVWWCERAAAGLVGATCQSDSSESYLKSCMISLRASLFLMILDKEGVQKTQQISDDMTVLTNKGKSVKLGGDRKFCSRQQADGEWVDGSAGSSRSKLRGGNNCSYSCLISWIFSWQSSSSGWSWARCLASCSLAVCWEGTSDTIYANHSSVEDGDETDDELWDNRSFMTLLTERKLSKSYKKGVFLLKKVLHITSEHQMWLFKNVGSAEASAF